MEFEVLVVGTKVYELVMTMFVAIHVPPIF